MHIRCLLKCLKENFNAYKVFVKMSEREFRTKHGVVVIRGVMIYNEGPVLILGC